MTPDELRSLADEATPGPWHVEGNSVMHSDTGDDPYVVEEVAELSTDARTPTDGDARLIALAPDLARLCAELGEALEVARPWIGQDSANVANWDDEIVDAEKKVTRALAKLSELKT